MEHTACFPNTCLNYYKGFCLFRFLENVLVCALTLLVDHPAGRIMTRLKLAMVSCASLIFSICSLFSSCPKWALKPLSYVTCRAAPLCEKSNCPDVWEPFHELNPNQGSLVFVYHAIFIWAMCVFWFLYRNFIFMLTYHASLFLVKNMAGLGCGSI